MASDALLSVADLVVERAGSPPVPLVDGVSFEVRRGERLALVGESGSGKTLTALALMRVLPPGIRVASGSVRFAGQELTALNEPQMRRVRGRRLAMALQDPLASLDPLMRVGEQVVESLAAHPGGARRQLGAVAIDLLRSVGLARPEVLTRRFPHELSGGMRQRVVLGAGLACGPDLLIADEPTTALDVATQARILRLLSDLCRERGMALLLVTHDLGIVQSLCDRVAVMYAGRLVEVGTTAEILGGPRHPYTEGLLASSPRLGGQTRRLQSISGQPPDPSAWASGCRFAPRCFRALPSCTRAYPPSVPLDGGRVSACWLAAPADD